MMFTKSELEIVKHRLQVPDAIAECLEDTWGYGIVADRASLLSENTHLIDWSSELDRDIVVDSLEGSTVFCGIEDAVALGEITKGAALAMHKAAKSLEAKLGITIPRG